MIMHKSERLDNSHYKAFQRRSAPWKHPSCIKFPNLKQIEKTNFETFPNSILTITSEQELPPYILCQYGPSIIIIILPTVLEHPIFGKP